MEEGLLILSGLESGLYTDRDGIIPLAGPSGIRGGTEKADLCELVNELPKRARNGSPIYMVRQTATQKNKKQEKHKQISEKHTQSQCISTKKK